MMKLNEALSTVTLMRRQLTVLEMEIMHPTQPSEEFPDHTAQAISMNATASLGFMVGELQTYLEEARNFMAPFHSEREINGRRQNGSMGSVEIPSQQV